MADFDTRNILKLHSDTCVRVSITFQVLNSDDSYSRLFTRVLNLLPNEDVILSLDKDFLK